MQKEVGSQSERQDTMTRDNKSEKRGKTEKQSEALRA